VKGNHFIPTSQMLGSPTPKAAVITAVSPQLADVREAHGHISQHQLRTITITDVGCIHLEGQGQALGIHDQVPLAAVDLLAAVETTFWATHIRGLDTLAVDDCGTRLHIAPESLTHHLAQDGMDGLPEAGEPPLS
jgi:hypothetical protein